MFFFFLWGFQILKALASVGGNSSTAVTTVQVVNHISVPHNARLLSELSFIINCP